MGLITILGVAAIVLAAVVAVYLETGGADIGDTTNTAMPLDPARGLLRVHPSNPRYFTDGSGKAIYLTGSHTWNNLQEKTDSNPPDRGPFDYAAYLDFLKNHNHNFMRMWVWEQAAWVPWTTDKVLVDPLPYLRTGPGAALDGRPKFDLSQFNPAYFDRLRSRVIAARDRGIYVAVMLFQGWSIGKKSNFPGNSWIGHPFHKDNNINGIDGDLNGNGQGEEIHTLQVPAVTALQEAYVRMVVDTLNDLDNVLWEISNESHGRSTDWQYHMSNYIKTYEASKSKQHPVGMTVEWPGGSNCELFASPADWISPNSDGGYMHDPPNAEGNKVIIADTDHFGDLGDDRAWVWKSFLRGLNPIYMDPLNSDAAREAARKAMGYTLSYAKRINLVAMAPHSDLASTGYCLANPGAEYLIYLPTTGIIRGRGIRALRWFSPLSGNRVLRWFSQLSGLNARVTVDLSAASGTLLTVEWFNPTTGKIQAAGTTVGGSSEDFTAPFTGDAALYLAGSKTASHL